MHVNSKIDLDETLVTGPLLYICLHYGNATKFLEVIESLYRKTKIKKSGLRCTLDITYHSEH